MGLQRIGWYGEAAKEPKNQVNSLSALIQRRCEDLTSDSSNCGYLKNLLSAQRLVSDELKNVHEIVRLGHRIIVRAVGYRSPDLGLCPAHGEELLHVGWPVE